MKQVPTEHAMYALYGAVTAVAFVFSAEIVAPGASVAHAQRTLALVSEASAQPAAIAKGVLALNEGGSTGGSSSSRSTGGSSSSARSSSNGSSASAARSASNASTGSTNRTSSSSSSNRSSVTGGVGAARSTASSERSSTGSRTSNNPSNSVGPTGGQGGSNSSTNGTGSRNPTGSTNRSSVTGSTGTSRGTGNLGATNRSDSTSREGSTGAQRDNQNTGAYGGSSGGTNRSDSGTANTRGVTSAENANRSSGGSVSGGIGSSGAVRDYVSSLSNRNSTAARGTGALSQNRVTNVSGETLNNMLSGLSAQEQQRARTAIGRVGSQLDPVLDQLSPESIRSLHPAQLSALESIDSQFNNLAGGFSPQTTGVGGVYDSTFSGASTFSGGFTNSVTGGVSGGASFSGVSAGTIGRVGSSNTAAQGATTGRTNTVSVSAPQNTTNFGSSFSGGSTPTGGYAQNSSGGSLGNSFSNSNAGSLTGGNTVTGSAAPDLTAGSMSDARVQEIAARYGSVTEFQRAMGLKADGIIGAQTREAAQNVFTGFSPQRNTVYEVRGANGSVRFVTAEEYNAANPRTVGFTNTGVNIVSVAETGLLDRAVNFANRGLNAFAQLASTDPRQPAPQTSPQDRIADAFADAGGDTLAEINQANQVRDAGSFRVAADTARGGGSVMNSFGESFNAGGSVAQVQNVASRNTATNPSFTGTGKMGRASTQTGGTAAQPQIAERAPTFSGAPTSRVATSFNNSTAILGTERFSPPANTGVQVASLRGDTQAQQPARMTGTAGNIGKALDDVVAPTQSNTSIVSSRPQGSLGTVVSAYTSVRETISGATRAIGSLIGVGTTRPQQQVTISPTGVGAIGFEVNTPLPSGSFNPNRVTQKPVVELSMEDVNVNPANPQKVTSFFSKAADAAATAFKIVSSTFIDTTKGKRVTGISGARTGEVITESTFGVPNVNIDIAQSKLDGTVAASDLNTDDIDALARVAAKEADKSREMLNAFVDNVLNRVASRTAAKGRPVSITEVLQERRQYTAVQDWGNGVVAKMPDAPQNIEQMVLDRVMERLSGVPSSVASTEYYGVLKEIASGASKPSRATQQGFATMRAVAVTGTQTYGQWVGEDVAPSFTVTANNVGFQVSSRANSLSGYSPQALSPSKTAEQPTLVASTRGNGVRDVTGVTSVTSPRGTNYDPSANFTEQSRSLETGSRSQQTSAVTGTLGSNVQSVSRATAEGVQIASIRNSLVSESFNNSTARLTSGSFTGVQVTTPAASDRQAGSNLPNVGTVSVARTSVPTNNRSNTPTQVSTSFNNSTAVVPSGSFGNTQVNTPAARNQQVAANSPQMGELDTTPAWGSVRTNPWESQTVVTLNVPSNVPQSVAQDLGQGGSQQSRITVAGGRGGGGAAGRGQAVEQTFMSDLMGRVFSGFGGVSDSQTSYRPVSTSNNIVPTGSFTGAQVDTPALRGSVTTVGSLGEFNPNVRSAPNAVVSGKPVINTESGQIVQSSMFGGFVNVVKTVANAISPVSSAVAKPTSQLTQAEQDLAFSDAARLSVEDLKRAEQAYAAAENIRALDTETPATLSPGSARTAEVRALQNYLGVSPDGRYGPNTISAVANFQRSYGIQATGIVDQQTRTALLAEGRAIERSAIATANTFRAQNPTIAATLDARQNAVVSTLPRITEDVGQKIVNSITPVDLASSRANFIATRDAQPASSNIVTGSNANTSNSFPARPAVISDNTVNVSSSFSSRPAVISDNTLNRPSSFPARLSVVSDNTINVPRSFPSRPTVISDNTLNQTISSENIISRIDGAFGRNPNGLAPARLTNANYYNTSFSEIELASFTAMGETQFDRPASTFPARPNVISDNTPNRPSTFPSRPSVISDNTPNRPSTFPSRPSVISDNTQNRQISLTGNTTANPNFTGIGKMGNASTQTGIIGRITDGVRNVVSSIDNYISARNRTATGVSFMDRIAGQPTMSELESLKYNFDRTRNLESITSTLRVGSRGEQVKVLQQALKDANYLQADVTGYFGTQTKAAVEAYQKALQAKNPNILVDGIVGPQIRTELRRVGSGYREQYVNALAKAKAVGGYSEAYATSLAAREVSNLTTNLGPGRGTRAQVESLQTFLKYEGLYTGPIDGIYGRGTTAAVAAYQKAKGLEQVGTVGPRTRASFRLRALEVEQALNAARPSSLQIAPVQTGSVTPAQLGGSSYVTKGSLGSNYSVELTSYNARQGVAEGTPNATQVKAIMNDIPAAIEKVLREQAQKQNVYTAVLEKRAFIDATKQNLSVPTSGIDAAALDALIERSARSMNDIYSGDITFNIKEKVIFNTSQSDIAATVERGRADAMRVQADIDAQARLGLPSVYIDSPEAYRQDAGV